MIYSFRRKMVLISAASVVAVFLIIFLTILLVSTVQMNRTTNMLTDIISENNGRFPAFDEAPPGPPLRDGMITRETPFSTRFFTVWTDPVGQPVDTNTGFISTVTAAQAESYAADALQSGSERGWIGDYRFKVVETPTGYTVVFVDAGVTRSMSRQFLWLVLAVLAASGLIITLLTVLLSKRAVRPVAESYEKQKQFITDANHELKTPLTLILSNLDIVENELGRNEWLDDIRSEGERMTVLVNKLVSLSRMDEDKSNLSLSQAELSRLLTESVSSFQPLAEERGIRLECFAEEPVFCTGDEGLLQQLVSLLLDNALKYCDPGGTVTVRCRNKRTPGFAVENSYKNVDSLELGRLFDRFYRADPARTDTTGFGIGLSLARAIVSQHHGSITAVKSGEGRIAFQVKLKA